MQPASVVYFVAAVWCVAAVLFALYLLAASR